MTTLTKDYNRWLQLCKQIQQATPIDTTETTAQKANRIKTLLADYTKFITYYFPHYATAMPAKFHVQAANKIRKEPNIKAVFEWARGHAKSVTFDIVIPMWLKAQGELHTMVLVAKSEDNACTLLGDLQAELQKNQRYINDFGTQLNFGDWQQGEYTTKDGCAFFARGRGQSPRGLRKAQYRPDYIVIDDIDDDELVLSPKRVTKITDWIKEALFGALDMGRGRFIMVGNRIHKDSVLARIAQTNGIYHSKVNALDQHGNVAWKEKYTLAEIQSAIEFMGYRAAQKEFFNNPIIEGTIFKHDWLKNTTQALPIQQYQTIIAYCDPSFKNTENADYKAIAVVAKTKNGQLHILQSFCRRCSINTMVSWYYDLFIYFNQNNVILQCYMEANFLQELILEEFVREGKIRGIQLPIRADKRNKPDKFARIEAISPLFERGIVKITDDFKKTTDGQTAIDQLLSLEKGTRTADDFPDALEGAIWLIQQQDRTHNPNNKPIFIPRTRKNQY